MGTLPLLGTGASAFDADALAYFTRAGISDATERVAVNNLFKTWKQNVNIWNSVKNGYVYLVSPTSYGASLFNAVSANFTPNQPTALLNPAYSTNGWSFNGLTHFLFTGGFNPATHMTLNTGLLAVYSRTNAQSNGLICGAADGANNQWNCILRTVTTNLARLRAFDGATQTGFANTNSSGTFVFSCTSSTNRFAIRNNTVLGTDVNPLGGALVNLECYVGCRNLSGVANGFVAYELSTVINGTVGLSTTDADILSTSIQTYNANVIAGGR